MLRLMVSFCPVVVNSETAAMMFAKTFAGEDEEGWVAWERISKGPVRSSVSSEGWTA